MLIEDYVTLRVPSSVDAAGARDAFLNLAKKYHPDSGHPAADEGKFKMIEKSYRCLLKKFSDERRHNCDAEGEYGLYYEEKKSEREKPADEEAPDKGFYSIKTSAPQHRQYLSYEGIGLGSPAQREKQFSRFKAMRATENIIDYKVQQLQQEHPETGLVAKEKAATRKNRTRYGLERVVEDLIQESMAKGEFDNLSCTGKPLRHDNYNPYLDVATHKLNQVLIENGYAPQWVQLEREIRDDKEWIKNQLKKTRATLGLQPLALNEQKLWDQAVASLNFHLSDLNKKIDRYNLLVPVLSKQMVHYPLDRISANILTESYSKHHPNVREFLASLNKAAPRHSRVDSTSSIDQINSGDKTAVTASARSVSEQTNPLQELLNVFKRTPK
ncbi:hypothetical protein HAZT_HAZT003464, partial [Hyalella azteca]